MGLNLQIVCWAFTSRSTYPHYGEIDVRTWDGEEHPSSIYHLSSLVEHEAEWSDMHHAVIGKDPKPSESIQPTICDRLRLEAGFRRLSLQCLEQIFFCSWVRLMFHVADIRAFIHFRSRDLGNMKPAKSPRISPKGRTQSTKCPLIEEAVRSKVTES